MAGTSQQKQEKFELPVVSPEIGPAGSPLRPITRWEPGTGHPLVDYAEKLLPQPQVVEALGLSKTNPRPMTSSLKSIVVPLRYR